MFYFGTRERIPMTVDLLYNLMIGWFYIAGTTCALWFAGGDDAFSTVLIGSGLFVVVTVLAALA